MDAYGHCTVIRNHSVEVIQRVLHFLEKIDPFESLYFNVFRRTWDFPDTKGWKKRSIFDVDTFEKVSAVSGISACKIYMQERWNKLKT